MINKTVGLVCYLITNIVIMSLLITIVVLSIYYTFVINDCNKRNVSIQECLGIEELVDKSINDLVNDTVSSLDKTLGVDSRKIIFEIPNIRSELNQVNKEIPKINSELNQINKELPKINSELLIINSELKTLNADIPKILSRLDSIDSELKEIHSDIRSLRLGI